MYLVVDLHVIQVNDERLLNFIVPKFSTTTENDVVVASAMMMSTLKA